LKPPTTPTVSKTEPAPTRASLPAGLRRPLHKPKTITFRRVLRELFDRLSALEQQGRGPHCWHCRSPGTPPWAGIPAPRSNLESPRPWSLAPPRPIRRPWVEPARRGFHPTATVGPWCGAHTQADAVIRHVSRSAAKARHASTSAWVSRLQSYTHRLAQLDLGGRASHYLCCVQQPRSKPCNLQAHAQPCRSHHSIGCSQHGDACLGCHGEMKRVEAAQRMPGVTRDQIGGL
jgi:hypothetical protein